MSTAPSKDIAMNLVTASLGLTVGTNLFVGMEPKQPSNCVTIFDTPGLPPEPGYTQDYRYEYPYIQIRVRNIDYVSGIELANRIKGYLHNKGAFTQNNVNYTGIVCVQDIGLLDYDGNGRVRFVSTYKVERIL